MERSAPLREPGPRPLGLLPLLPNPERGALNLAHVKSAATAGSRCSKILRRLRRLGWRNALTSSSPASFVLGGSHGGGPTPRGCSSIYAAACPPRLELPTVTAAAPPGPTPCSKTNAEFGTRFPRGFDQRRVYLPPSAARHAAALPPGLPSGPAGADQHDEPGIFEQRQRVVEAAAVAGGQRPNQRPQPTWPTDLVTQRLD